MVDGTWPWLGLNPILNPPDMYTMYIDLDYPTDEVESWIHEHIRRTAEDKGLHFSIRWNVDGLSIEGPYNDCDRVRKIIARLSRGKPSFTVTRVWGFNNIPDVTFAALLSVKPDFGR